MVENKTEKKIFSPINRKNKEVYKGKYIEAVGRRKESVACKIIQGETKYYN